MFRVDSGVVNDNEVDLIPDPEEAKRRAKELIEECRRKDRYANPDHPRYDPVFAEQIAEEYAARIRHAENLRDFALNANDDLAFLEVFGHIETEPATC